MKELEPFKKDPKELHAIKPDKRELKYLGTLRPHHGQKVWQLDLKTMIISEAKYELGVLDFKKAQHGDFSTRHRLVAQENCLYVCAINAKNADKKFHKMIGVKFQNANKKYKQKGSPSAIEK